MDIVGAATRGTAAVPWLVLGVLLGVGLVLLAGAATALALRRRPGSIQDDPGGDDLPGFLESPPGAGTPAAPAGWAPLAPPPAPAPATPPRRDTVLTLGAMAATALLLLGAAAAVAAISRAEDRTARARPTAAATSATAATGAAARLTFGGLVLEPRAVGVTATYPVVEVTPENGRTRVRVEFPTFNCLTVDAPADPVAAGCTRAPTEYAELTAPDVTARADGDGLAVTGRFATEVHPFGGPPAATGRVYVLRITAAPAGGTAENGWRPARGVIELGPERAVTVDTPGVNVLRSAS